MAGAVTVAKLLALRVQRDRDYTAANLNSWIATIARIGASILVRSASSEPSLNYFGFVENCLEGTLVMLSEVEASC
jgi:hypothetical protein